MSDRQGLLRLPMTEAGDPATTSIGDPLLDVLGDYLRAAVNYDTKVGWAALHPRSKGANVEPVPVTTVFTHDPKDSSFDSKALPALFVWRMGWPRLMPLTQEWKAQVSQVGVLWVPPPDRASEDARRDPFKNAVAKAIHRAVERCRNPGWVVEGDTDPKAEVYGSFLIEHANIAKVLPLDVKHFPIIIEKQQTGQPYDGLLATLEITEILTPLLDDAYPDWYVDGSYGLTDDTLTTVSFELRPTVASVTPSTGPTAGGTAITVSGFQFFEDEFLGSPTVSIDGVACTSVAYVDERTITAVTPAGTAGAKTLTVTLPNEVTASLASAFTFA